MGQGQSTTSYHPSAVGPHNKASATFSNPVKVQNGQQLPSGQVTQRDFASRAARPSLVSPTTNFPGHFSATPSPPGHPRPIIDGTSPEDASPQLVRRARPEPQGYFDPTRVPTSSSPVSAWGGWRPARDRTVSLSALSTTSQAGSGAGLSSAPASEQATAALRAIHRIPEMPEEGTDSEGDEAATVASSGPAPTPRRLSVPLAEALRMGLGRSASGSSHSSMQDWAPDETRTRTHTPQEPRLLPHSSKRETGETDRERLVAFWAREEARQAALSADDRSSKRMRRHSWSSSAADTSGEEPHRRTRPAPSDTEVHGFEDPYEDATVDAGHRVSNVRQTSIYGTPMVDYTESPYSAAQHVGEEILPPNADARVDSAGVRLDLPEDLHGRDLSAAHDQLNSGLTTSNYSLMSAARPSSSFEGTPSARARHSRHRGPGAQGESYAGHVECAHGLAAFGAAGHTADGASLLQPPTMSRVPDPQFTSSSSDFEDSEEIPQDHCRGMSQSDPIHTELQGPGGEGRQSTTSKDQPRKSPSPVYVSQLDSVLIPSPRSHTATTSEDHTKMTTATSSSSEAHSTRASAGARTSDVYESSPQYLSPDTIPTGLVSFATPSAGPVANLRAQNRLSNSTGVASQVSHGYSPSQTSEADAMRRADIELLRSGPSFRRDEQAAQLLQPEHGTISRNTAAAPPVQSASNDSAGRSRTSSLFSKFKTRVRKGSDAILSSSVASHRKGSALGSAQVDPTGSDMQTSSRAGLPSQHHQPSTLNRSRGRQVSAPPAMTQVMPDKTPATSVTTTSSRLVPREEVSAFSGGKAGVKKFGQVRRKPVQYPVGSLKKPPSVSGSLRSSRSARSARSMRSMRSAASLQGNKGPVTPQQRSPRLLSVKDAEDDEEGRNGMEVLTIGDWLRNDATGGGDESRRSGRSSTSSRLAVPPVSYGASGGSLSKSNTSPLAKADTTWEDIEEEKVEDTTIGQTSGDVTIIAKPPTAADTTDNGVRERKRRGLGSVLGWSRRASRPQESDTSDEGAHGKVTPFVTPSSAVLPPRQPREGPTTAAERSSPEEGQVPQPQRLKGLAIQSVPIANGVSQSSSSFTSLAPPPAPQPLPPQRPRRPRNRRAASDSQTGSQSEGGATIPSPQPSRAPLRTPNSAASQSPAAPVWDESLPVGAVHEAAQRNVSSPHGTLATIQSSFYIRADDDAASRVLSDDRGISERGSADADMKSMRSPFGVHVALQSPGELTPSDPAISRARHAHRHSHSLGANPPAVAFALSNPDAVQGSPASTTKSSVAAAILRQAHPPPAYASHEPSQDSTPSRSSSSKRRPLPTPPAISAHARAASNSLTSDAPTSPDAGFAALQRHPAESSTASFVKHPGEDELRARIRVPSQAESDLSVASARGHFSSSTGGTAQQPPSVKRRGAVHRRGVSGSAASERLSAALDNDDARQASRGAAGDVAGNADTSMSTAVDAGAEEPLAASNDPRRPLPTPPVSPTETTAVASPAMWKDIDGLPAAATSPTFKSLALNRHSWQSADGPWKADVVMGTPAQRVRGYATPSKTDLRSEDAHGARHPSTAAAPQLGERRSSEPVATNPSFTGRVKSPTEDMPLPKGGVQASLAALKALESTGVEDEAKTGQGATLSRFLGSTEYQLPQRSKMRIEQQLSEAEELSSSGDSRRHRHRGKRRQHSRYYSTEEGFSSVDSRAYHRDERQRRRERSRYQVEYGHRGDARRVEDRASYVRRAAAVSQREPQRRRHRHDEYERRHRHHGRDQTGMAVVSDAGLVDTDVATSMISTGSEVTASSLASEDDWIDYSGPRAGDRQRQRVMGSAARPSVPPRASRRTATTTKRSSRQYASEMADGRLSAVGRVLLPDEDAERLHYITPPRKASREAAAAVLAGGGAPLGRRDASGTTTSTIRASNEDESTAQGHERFRTAVAESVEDWDEVVVPAVRRQLERERQMEEEMAAAAARAAEVARHDPASASATAGNSVDAPHVLAQDSIRFPTARGSKLPHRRREDSHWQDTSYGGSARAHHGHEEDGTHRSRHRPHRHRHADEEQKDPQYRRRDPSDAPRRHRYEDEEEENDARYRHRDNANPPRRRHRPSASTTATATATTAPPEASQQRRPRHSKRGLEKEDILVWQRASALVEGVQGSDLL